MGESITVLGQNYGPAGKKEIKYRNREERGRYKKMRTIYKKIKAKLFLQFEWYPTGNE
jgi:hypothetical protein